MKKYIAFFLFSFFILIYQISALNIDIKSDKIIVVNLNEDMVLYEKNADVKSQIASLTKIVTAITVIENTPDLNKEVVITNEMVTGYYDYAKAGFKVNDKVTILELLYALMLPSGCDAALALAIETSGDVKSFANLMNEKVNDIGVVNTKFSNPIGKDEVDNYSTARDLYIILKYALKNDIFKKIFESNKYYINALNKEVEKTLLTISNEKELDTSIIQGAKTGYTDDAGLCLASTSSYNGIDYMIISINGPLKSLSYISDSVDIYNYYFNNYGYKTIVKTGDILHTLVVKNSFTKNYDIVSNINKELYLNNKIELEEINIVYNGINEIDNSVKLGDKLGEINYIYNDELLFKHDVFLEKNIKHFNILHYLLLILGCVAIILFIILISLKFKTKIVLEDN